MGYIIRLKRNQLVGGNNNDEIYPITSTNAVYRGGKNLEDILDELGKDIDSKKVTEVSYNKSTNSIKVSYSNGDVDNLMYPRLPKLVAAVSTNGNKLRITYLEDKETSGQSYTDIDLPSGGSNITVNNKNATLTAGSTVTLATMTVDNSAVDINVNIPNFVVNNGGIPKIQYVASKATFDSMTKEANTLYFIPVDS